eukprot:TRINITY_DN11234_c0_g1_i1.p1 TRINITY_DN11234_c0_g1~~TRINITY_DN11234_c0_g1_i1.p1  ORF type:complete len:331 (+),score=106.77 TRINITY_DN11234_c0_g1_i1:63-1055(+)
MEPAVPVAPLRPVAAAVPDSDVQALQQLLTCAASRAVAVTGDLAPLRAAAKMYLNSTQAAVDEGFREVDTLLLDVRGTLLAPDTTSRLVAYAEAHIEPYLREYYEDAVVQEVVHQMRVVSRWDRDLQDGVPVVPGWGDTTDNKEQVIHGAVANFLFNSRADRKIPAFKTLQGMVWQDGQERGAVQAALLPDVIPALHRFATAGVSVHVYSSASAATQRLLFTHTAEGDVTRYIAGYFDTSVGAKRDPASYECIAATLRRAHMPSRILFLTKTAEEALAAAAAGLRAAVVHRAGNPPVWGAVRLPQVLSLDDVRIGRVAEKRPREDDDLAA